jgi:predicted nucleic acid-binding protein
VGGVKELQRVISSHELLLLDTMVFSYHLSDHPRYAPLAAMILEAVESGDLMGLTTTVTLAELLTVPAKGNNRRAMQEYELYLTRFPNLQMVPLNIALARETAIVRAATGLRMPDAVQVAAARLSGADGIVTSDQRWVKRVAQPALVLLGDYVDAG